MPQTAYSLHLFVRKGGYEPSTGLHYTSFVGSAQSKCEAWADELAALLPTSVELSRWEQQDNLGNVLDGGTLAVPGLWLASFGSFKDCTHITWQSVGPGGFSGGFIHPRPLNAYVEGEPIPQWATAMETYIAWVSGSSFTDSEGAPITGAVRYTPSRRRKVRLAP